MKRDSTMQRRPTGLMPLASMVLILLTGCSQSSPTANSNPSGQNADQRLRSALAEGPQAASTLRDLEISFQFKDQQLVSLYLSQSFVNDEIAAELVNHKEMRNLSLAGSAISDEACRTLGQLNQLQSLDLSNTTVTSEGLSHLTQLSELRLLNLQNTKIDDKSLTFVNQLESLADLNLAGTSISDEGLRHLTKLPALQYLDLTSTQVTGTGVAEAEQRLPQLRRARFAGVDEAKASSPVRPPLSRRPLQPAVSKNDSQSNSPTAGRPVERPSHEHQWHEAVVREMLATPRHDFPGLLVSTGPQDALANAWPNRGRLAAALTSLGQDQIWFDVPDSSAVMTSPVWLCFGEMSGLHIGHEGLQRLQAIPELHLDLTGSHLTDEAWSELAKLNNLRSLRLTRTNLSDTHLLKLEALAQLEELSVSSTNVSDEGLAIVSKFTGLKRLFAASTRVTDKGLMSISELLSLEELDLSSTAITAAGLQHLSDRSTIRRLSLGNTHITGEAVRTFAAEHPDCSIGF